MSDFRNLARKAIKTTIFVSLSDKLTIHNGLF
jgi:hypothetical protein